MVLFLYTLAIRGYRTAARVFALLNHKANAWLLGQEHYKTVDLSGLRGDKVVWFHCASVGEFEQARPVIERQKEIDPSIRVLLTFFSPSGFELRKDYSFADCITYLPIDLPNNVTAFLDRFKPDAVVFIKYELWFNFIIGINRRSIPMALICANFPEKHLLFRPFFNWFLIQLEGLSTIHVQNKETQLRLESHGLKNVQLAGDTRTERVIEVASLPFRDKDVESFIGQYPVLVIGSFWVSDAAILMQEIQNTENLKIIVVPHELSAINQSSWYKGFGSEIFLWSERGDSDISNKKVLYIDCIGLLSRMYRYATIAYVGGGFGFSVHNTLEAAIYGVPVIFGPNNKRFYEIQELKRFGSGFEIKSQFEFRETMNRLMIDESLRKSIAQRNQQYFLENQGATEKALNWIKVELEHKKSPLA